MKPSKLLLYALAVGMMSFAANRALAALGEVTVSGKVYYQDYDKNDNAIIKKASIKQADILTLLAAATGEDSIADKKTKLLWDPDYYNTAAYYSYYGQYYYGDLPRCYGRFYVTNSTLGLYPLDGSYYDGYEYVYYSYIELDSSMARGVPWNSSYNWGFVSPYNTEWNYVTKEKESSSSGSISLQGNAIFYVHYYEDYYAIDYYYNDFTEGRHYLANNVYGSYQPYALAIRGATTFDAKVNSSGKLNEQLQMKKAPGEGMWTTDTASYMPIVVEGSVKFKGKGVID